MDSAERILSMEVDGRRWRGSGPRPVGIGRTEGQLRVHGPGVSGLHLVAEVRAGRWVVEDRSTYGTFLDGVRLHELALDRPVALRLGHPDRGPLLRLSLDAAYDRAAPPAHPTVLVPTPADPALDAVTLRSGSAVVQVRAGTTARVGRAIGSDLQVDHPAVSREHLRVLQCGDRWLAVDERTRRGTYLRGRRADSVRLGRRTVLRLGGRAGPVVVAEVGIGETGGPRWTRR